MNLSFIILFLNKIISLKIFLTLNFFRKCSLFLSIGSAWTIHKYYKFNMSNVKLRSRLFCFLRPLPARFSHQRFKYFLILLYRMRLIDLIWYSWLRMSRMWKYDIWKFSRCKISRHNRCRVVIDSFLFSGSITESCNFLLIRRINNNNSWAFGNCIIKSSSTEI